MERRGGATGVSCPGCTGKAAVPWPIPWRRILPPRYLSRSAGEGRCQRSSARAARSAPTPTLLSHTGPHEEMHDERPGRGDVTAAAHTQRGVLPHPLYSRTRGRTRRCTTSDLGGEMSPQQRTRSAECSHTHSTLTHEAARSGRRRRARSTTSGGRRAAGGEAAPRAAPHREGRARARH
jgi:hypothetical protein